MGSPTQGHLHDARRAPERSSEMRRVRKMEIQRVKLPCDRCIPLLPAPPFVGSNEWACHQLERVRPGVVDRQRGVAVFRPTPGGAVRRLLCLACSRGQPCRESKCYKSQPRACVWGTTA